MDRRKFFKLFGIGVAGIALEQAIPLGRVWSFPSEIVVPTGNLFLRTEWITMESLRILEEHLRFSAVVARRFDDDFVKISKIGNLVQIQKPRHSVLQTPIA